MTTARHAVPSIGHFYQHPQDGPIYVTAGHYEIDHRTSNHFHWTVVATGESHHGYAGMTGPWVNIDDQWQVVFKRRPVDNAADETPAPRTVDESRRARYLIQPESPGNAGGTK